MKKKNHWLIFCVFLFPQLLWGLEAHDQSNTESFESDFLFTPPLKTGS